MRTHTRGRTVRLGLAGLTLICSLTVQGNVSRAQAPATPPSAPAASVQSLSWITGTWGGTLGGATLEEHWLTPAGGTMLGISRTVAGERMVAFEFLRIEARADGVYYVAQPGGRPPTAFKLTSSSAQSAVFENPQHDHPKTIRYLRDGDTLVAEIEGDEKGKPVKQAFTFTLKRP